jgi:hypothetical protein
MIAFELWARSDDEGETDTAARAQLAFWAKGMVEIRTARMSWPGFSYADDEWARMAELAATIENSRYGLFKLINALLFIALAAAGICGLWLPLVTVMFPVPAETRALPFTLLLAACALFMVTAGLPLSMRLAAGFAADAAMRARRAMLAGDDTALARKIRHQINRVVVLMCGVLVPGTLIFIAYQIEAGPLITALKWTGFALLAGSVGYAGAARLRG